MDFGSFKNAARDSNIRRGIELSFDFNIDRRRLLFSKPIARRSGSPEAAFAAKNVLNGSVSILLGRSDGDAVGDIRRLAINFGGDVVRISYGTSGEIAGLTVGNRDISQVGESEWHVVKGAFIPGFEVYEKHYVSFGDDDELDYFWDQTDDPFIGSVIECVSSLAHGNTSPEKLRSIASRLKYADYDLFHEQLKDMSGTTPAFRYNVANSSSDSIPIQQLRHAVLLNELPTLLRLLDEELADFSKSVRYIEPIRATAERYYRQQDLAVDDIDSRGTNTAMFLNSLDEDDLLALQGWMKRYLGFTVHIDSSVGHVEVKVDDGEGDSRNIADLGFGYSQMLPIILQLWVGRRRRPGKGPDIVAIEQPELHLHPHYQALLADLMVGATASPRARPRLRILVETHSDHFINRLGALVASGRLSRKDVQVIVVSDGADGSAVSICNFDSEGLFDDNWPAGFFNAGVA